MPWGSGPPTVVVGDVIAAATGNLYRDLLLETAPAKVTAAGDLVYATGAGALARLAASTSGYVLTAQGAGVAPAWAPSVNPDLLPWLIEIDTLARGATNSGWNTIATDSLTIYGGYLFSDSGAQNNEVTWPVVLAAGTWTVRLVHTTGPNVGVYTIQFDGVSKGTVDGYSAGTVPIVVSDVAGISVPTTAKVTLKFLMATKNASSSSYNGALRHVRLLRTA